MIIGPDILLPDSPLCDCLKLFDHEEAMIPLSILCNHDAVYRGVRTRCAHVRIHHRVRSPYHAACTFVSDTVRGCDRSLLWI